jgi:hypothetical protein
MKKRKIEKARKAAEDAQKLLAATTAVALLEGASQATSVNEILALEKTRPKCKASVSKGMISATALQITANLRA